MENEIHEIPVTHYGVNEAKRLWIDFEPKTINELDASFEHLLELLLSYCNGEACDFQGDYRYYVHIPTQKVFKESAKRTTYDLCNHLDLFSGKLVVPL